MSSDGALINKYRPQAFNEVVGNTLAVNALQAAIDGSSTPHAFLFSGPSGIGKTTLARIIGNHLQAHIEEVDAGTNSGIDATKAIVEISYFQPLMANKQVLIIDECHGISKQGWNPLLKLLEEPPDYLYLALCTTELEKVPETIRTRTLHTVLKPCSMREIEDLILLIADLEGWQLAGDVVNGLVGAATGQPRKAISYLQAGHSCQTREELSQVIAAVESESGAMLQLMNYLVKGGKDWKRCAAWLREVEDSEDAWSTCTRYQMNLMLREDTSEQQAQAAHRILDSLLFPRAGFDRKAQLVEAIAAFLWNTGEPF
jgi:DNA polymerase III gamma/tau subunit